MGVRSPPVLLAGVGGWGRVPSAPSFPKKPPFSPQRSAHAREGWVGSDVA